MNEVSVSMVNINKSFYGVPVLIDTCFELRKGEIHALLGENGAGKSTLMKILAADYTKDSGDIFIKGNKVAFTKPEDAIQAKIAFVHQELSILPTISVGENIFAGRQPKKGFIVDWGKIYSDAEKILNRLSVSDFNAKTNTSELSVGQKQIVEIAKALALDADVLIMDEPTSSLSAQESEKLFSIIRALAKEGKSFIYISHRLQEILDLCDRITVLRDGKTIGTVSKDEVDISSITEMMVGRKVEDYSVSEEYDEEILPEVLNAQGISCPRVKGADIVLHKGEIVCLYGLVGAGRTELARAILNPKIRTSGTVIINGKDVTNYSYRNMLTLVGFLPEERKTQAVFTDLPVYHNVTITDLSRIKKHGILNFQRERDYVNKYIKELRIKGAYNSMLKDLSGGTQQKVALSKWLYAENTILFLDEPTKGIDIQARYEIYDTLINLSTQGASILVISSDVEEVLSIAHRILIMCDGEITKELKNDERVTEEVILTYAIKSSR